MAEPTRTRLPLTRAPELALRAGSRFAGLVLLHGPSRIDGCIRGEVIASGTLWIGEAAEIDGPVSAENLVIAGSVKGDLRARGRIALEPSARVRGEVEAQRLILAEGSFLEGVCRAGALGDGPEPTLEPPASRRVSP